MHERTATASEAERQFRGRQLAAKYLVTRDGMTEELAAIVIEGLDDDTINALIVEANTKTISKGTATVPSGEEAEPVLDFTQIEELVTDGQFAIETARMIDSARIKNDAEKEYKSAKIEVVRILDGHKVKRCLFGGVKLSRYQGNNRRLSVTKLIEKGVDPDLINACYEDSPYEDVRITFPKSGVDGV